MPRWFIFPRVQGTGSRAKLHGAKYISDAWEDRVPQPPGTRPRGFKCIHHRIPGELRWELVHFLILPQVLEAWLESLPDVYALPEDMTTIISNPEYNRLRNMLRGYGFPTDWLVNNTTTYQEIVDEVLEMMPVLGQAVKAVRRPLTFSDPDDVISPEDAAALDVGADAMGYQRSTGTTIGERLEHARTQGRG